MITKKEIISKATSIMDKIIIYIQNFNESQRFAVIIGGFSFVVIWFFIRSQKTNYNLQIQRTNVKVNSVNDRSSFHNVRIQRRKEYFTIPGTFDMVEERPHKFSPRNKPSQKSQESWDKDLEKWVKDRKKNR